MASRPCAPNRRPRVAGLTGPAAGDRKRHHPRPTETSPTAPRIRSTSAFWRCAPSCRGEKSCAHARNPPALIRAREKSGLALCLLASALVPTLVLLFLSRVLGGV